MFVSKTANNSCKKVTMILENNTWCKYTAKTQTGETCFGLFESETVYITKVLKFVKYFLSRYQRW